MAFEVFTQPTISNEFISGGGLGGRYWYANPSGFRWDLQSYKPTSTISHCIRSIVGLKHYHFV